MIILDNFLRGERKDSIQNELFWGNEGKTGLRIKWFGWGQRVSNPVEDFCFYFWDEVFPKYQDSFSEGWEYWAHHLGPDRRDNMDFHMDTDVTRSMSAEEEQRLVDEGSARTANYGFIYYAHTEPCVGGYLEIKRSNDELERIEPVPNRLVLFTPNKQHRVTKVTKGYRRSIVSNLWVKTPKQYII